MKKWILNNRLYFIGAVLGGLAGYFYWQQIGCVSGTCAITSNPLNSTAYGSILGTLVFGSFKREKSGKKEISGTGNPTKEEVHL